MTAAVSIRQKYGLLPFSEDLDFEHWIHEIEMRQLVTDLNKEKQGPVLYLSLSPKVRQACASLTKEELNKENGMELLIAKLRELYAVSKDQAMFTAYEQFETFQRLSSINITEYVNQFEQLNCKLKSFKIDLPSPVLAYQLLKNANLPKSKRDLARATIRELKYEDMKRQIKAIYDTCTSDDKTPETPEDIVVESEATFFSRNHNLRDNRYRGRGGYRTQNRQNEQHYNRSSQSDSGRQNERNYNRSSQSDRGNRSYQSVRFTRVKNCPDTNGNPTRCNICELIYHYYRDCPDADKKDTEVKIQLFTKEESEVDLCFLEQMVAETLSCAVIDSGCTSNVCGQNWLKCYLDSLPSSSQLDESSSIKSYQFGAGKSYPSLKKVNIPVNIGGQTGQILTDVVDCEIPLLLSKSSIKAAEGQLDFVNDTITLFGTEIDLQHTSSGHYCIPISPKQIVVNHNSKDVSSAPVKLYLTIDNLNTKSTAEKKEVAVKLHKQFGHPVESRKLKTVLHEAAIDDNELLKTNRHCYRGV